MNKEINLIHTHSQSPFAILFDRITIIRVIAFGLLTIVSALSMAFFLLVTFSPLPALRQKEQSELSQMQTLAKKKGVLLGVQDRLNSISKLLSNRSDIAALIQGVQNHITSIETSTQTQMDLSSFAIDKKTVKLQVETSSLDAMNQFLDVMSQKQDKPYAQVVMDGISLDQTRGVYITGLTIQL